MKGLWKIGLFAKDKSYLEEAFEFSNKLIKDKDETIILTKKMSDTFEVQTDKTLYIFKIANHGVRGYRWHEVFIFDAYLIDREIIDICILPKIVPYDMWNRDIEWKIGKYIHFLEKNYI